jgi:hypothetical protein
MAAHLRLSSLAPSGLIVESITESEDAVLVSGRARALARACPLCGTQSSRVHSRYVRTISDLPCAGRRVRLRLVARRFVCEKPSCRRRIFAERFDEGTVAVRCRRTMRLECIVHHLGLALGGRPVGIVTLLGIDGNPLSNLRSQAAAASSLHCRNAWPRNSFMVRRDVRWRSMLKRL